MKLRQIPGGVMFVGIAALAVAALVLRLAGE